MPVVHTDTNKGEKRVVFTSTPPLSTMLNKILYEQKKSSVQIYATHPGTDMYG
jgi:hypothetical protein